MKTKRSAKPRKPYPEFPLTAHSNGQWCKKIRGKVHYFGSWNDSDGALNLYKQQCDDLHAGRKPRVGGGGQTLAYALDHFLSSKAALLQTGELKQCSYRDYVKTCDHIADSIDKDRMITDIDSDDLFKLRADLSKSKTGKSLSTVTLKGELTRARMLFLHVNENLGANIKYRKPLKTPSRREQRKVANQRGPRMFSTKEIKAMLRNAPPQLKAMILLGINCGFGNADCATLPIEQLDLAAGWHTYWRPKTHTPRRCPLWKETIEALRAVIEDRASGPVFTTRFNNGWAKESGHNAISLEIRKLLTELGIYRKGITTFYSLRRTFETIGASTGEQVAVDYIMGHIADGNDMAAVYRQKQFDGPLRKVTTRVHSWLYKNLKIA